MFLSFILENVVNVLITLFITFIFGAFANLFIIRSNYKSIAQIVLKGTIHMKDTNAYKVFKNFVKPDFIPFAFYTNKTVLSFGDLWKSIVINKSKNTGLFIYAEAGMGKTRLMEYLAFKLMLKEKRNKNNNYGVYFARLNEYESVNDLIIDLRKANDIKYVLLDGFDEFKALRYKNPNELCEEFFNKIEEIGSRYHKIIISSRIELLLKGEEEIKLKSIRELDESGVKKDKTFEIVKINYLDYNKAINTYKSFMRNSNEKISMWEKHKNIKKLKKFLFALKGKDTIFRNSFFVTKADVIISNISLNNSSAIEEITSEDALDRIVDDSFYKEYKTCLSLGKIGNNEKAEDNFKSALSLFLDEITITMINNDTYSVTNDDIDINKLNYLNTRALVVRNLDKLEFIHRIFLEYFISRNIQNIEHSKKVDILSGKVAEIDNANIFKFYTNFIKGCNDSLKYNINHILRSVDSYNDKVHVDKNANIHDLINSYSIKVKEYPILTIDQIFEICPFLNRIQYRNYELRDLDLLEYIFNKDLCLDKQNLTNLDGINAFGYFKSLDIQDNEISDSTGLSEYNHIDCIWISDCTIKYLVGIRNVSIQNIHAPIRNKNHILDILKNKNILFFNFRLEPDSNELIDLYKEIYDKVNNYKNISLSKTILKKNEITNIVIDMFNCGNRENKYMKVKRIFSFLAIALKIGVISGFNKDNEHLLYLSEIMTEINKISSIYEWREKNKLWYEQVSDYIQKNHDLFSATHFLAEDINNDGVYEVIVSLNAHNNRPDTFLLLINGELKVFPYSFWTSNAEFNIFCIDKANQIMVENTGCAGALGYVEYTFYDYCESGYVMSKNICQNVLYDYDGETKLAKDENNEPVLMYEDGEASGRFSINGSSVTYNEICDEIEYVHTHILPESRNIKLNSYENASDFLSKLKTMLIHRQFPHLANLFIDLIMGCWVDCAYYECNDINESVVYPFFKIIIVDGVQVNYFHEVIDPFSRGGSGTYPYTTPLEICSLQNGILELKCCHDFYAGDTKYFDFCDTGPYINHRIIIDLNTFAINKIKYYNGDKEYYLVPFKNHASPRFQYEVLSNGIRIAWHGHNFYLRDVTTLRIYRSKIKNEKGILIGENDLIAASQPNSQHMSLAYEFFDASVEEGNLYYYSLWKAHSYDWEPNSEESVMINGRHEYINPLYFESEWQIEVAL